MGSQLFLKRFSSHGLDQAGCALPHLYIFSSKNL